MVLFAKICLLGDGQVGKTSLRNQYMGKGVPGDYLPTLGADFASTQVNIPFNNTKKSIRFQIWDLAGQPTFNQIRALYYRQTAGALIVYDINDRNSLQNLRSWVQELTQHMATPSVCINILGNKSDLRDENSITTLEAETYISEQIIPRFKNIEGEIKHFVTSAKTGENVEEAFITLGRKLLNRAT
ncbi:MAG: GTP-binding protein [Candidatus Hodarchaeales archaeon]|jgi:small GTP-binding protein